jgi:hypothetical protein
MLTGSRVFALGMIRGGAEARNQTLHYTVGSEKGTAKILAEAPAL